MNTGVNKKGKYLGEGTVSVQITIWFMISE